MGLNQSKDIRYILANIDGKKVSIPYIRMPDGHWAPLQQNWILQQQHWNAQRTSVATNPYINPALIPSRPVYPVLNP